MSTVVPDDVTFKQAFDVARAMQANLARYYLRSLERTAKEEPAPYFIPLDDKDTINLEHVLPENPDQSWQRSFSDDAVSHWAYRIGNLALLLAKTNSTRSGASFKTKKTGYIRVSQMA